MPPDLVTDLIRIFEFILLLGEIFSLNSTCVENSVLRTQKHRWILYGVLMRLVSKGLNYRFPLHWVCFFRRWTTVKLLLNLIRKMKKIFLNSSKQLFHLRWPLGSLIFFIFTQNGRVGKFAWRVEWIYSLCSCLCHKFMTDEFHDDW